MLALNKAHVIHNHKRASKGKNKLTLLDYQKLLVASLCNQVDQNVNFVVDEVAAQMEVA